ncbi:MAG: molybdopterin-dependent oxidoreductase, partial [Acidimicrobiia bacterium]|nr:molybdopterin-dependent oxidoreductase [Acidimicrobiia bacterium]
GYEVSLPSRTGAPIRYDGGDYRRTLDLALEVADSSGFAQRRTETEKRGLRRGLGLASYVEDTGTGPSEGARVAIDRDGTVRVDVGVSSQGQGHVTVFTQLASDALGVEPERVVVVSGDTGNFPTGKSTVASRTAVTAGPAVHTAATEVATAVKRAAAEMLEAAEADLRLSDGRVEVVGMSGMGVSIKDVAVHLHQQDRGNELTAHEDVPFSSAAFAFGSNVAEVIVDPETGLVEVVDYSVAHDCGTVLNPMIVAGQIAGGVVHGLGNALLERVATSEDGQPQVTSFIDYRIMGASEVPSIRQAHTETPSPTNLLGARGAGEGGTLPAMAAVAAAVEDALSPWGVVVDRYPLQPEVVRRLMRDAAVSRDSVE